MLPPEGPCTTVHSVWRLFGSPSSRFSVAPLPLPHQILVQTLLTIYLANALDISVLASGCKALFENFALIALIYVKVKAVVYCER